MKKIKWIFYYVLALPVMLHAQLYYWIDAKGVQHYSSTPPENRQGIRDFKVFEADAGSAPQNAETGPKTQPGTQGKAYPSVVMYTTSR